MFSSTAHELVPGACIFTGRLPGELLLDAARFEELWSLHPDKNPVARFESGSFPVARWHQAYGRDYAFSGFTSKARPIPGLLRPVFEWTRREIDERINGVLVNWYDGRLEHRISQHKDSPMGRVAGCPIVTVSLGATRGFQMVVKKRRLTFEVRDGDVILIPDEVNERFAHAVPHRTGDTGRRISVTLRAFEDHLGVVSEP